MGSEMCIRDSGILEEHFLAIASNKNMNKVIMFLLTNCYSMKYIIIIIITLSGIVAHFAG